MENYLDSKSFKTALCKARVLKGILKNVEFMVVLPGISDG